ncbi:hypothetical protein EZS27_012956 [termite gut metagenome]|uniref:Uncharacterized protein n=1 Tax=termite gut metagenome TaxID=433724 RepID=A0A5J4S0T6_9ZZZZ
MMKDKKGGRPKLSPAEKLKYWIPVRLCTDDFYNLQVKAKAVGMTKTELARKAIIGCQIHQRLTPEHGLHPKTVRYGKQSESDYTTSKRRRIRQCPK